MIPELVEADETAILNSPAASWWSEFRRLACDRKRVRTIGDGWVSVRCEGWPGHAKWLRDHLIGEGAPPAALRIARKRGRTGRPRPRGR